VILTESLLKPALAAAEGDLGRRDPLTSMIASMSLHGCLGQDRPQEAAALLAHRLDVLGVVAFPRLCFSPTELRQGLLRKAPASRRIAEGMRATA
jgi:hypothetical protein